MGKNKTEFGENQAGATAKFLRVPPRKARLVMDAVRGKYVADALALLKFVPNFAARAIEKVIVSAVANAENSRPVSETTGKPLPSLLRENLKLVRGMVDEGPRIKRLQPRAQGRAYRILKRMCHISVIVEETAPRPRPQRKVAPKRAAAAAVAAGRTAVPARTRKVEAASAAEPEVIVAAPVVEAVAVEATAPEVLETTPEATESAPADVTTEAPEASAAEAPTSEKSE